MAPGHIMQLATLTAAVLKPVLKTLMALHFKPVKTNMNTNKMLIIFNSIELQFEEWMWTKITTTDKTSTMTMTTTLIRMATTTEVRVEFKRLQDHVHCNQPYQRHGHHQHHNVYHHDHQNHQYHNDHYDQHDHL